MKVPVLVSAMQFFFSGTKHSSAGTAVICNSKLTVELYSPSMTSSAVTFHWIHIAGLTGLKKTSTQLTRTKQETAKIADQNIQKVPTPRNKQTNKTTTTLLNRIFHPSRNNFETKTMIPSLRSLTPPPPKKKKKRKKEKKINQRWSYDLDSCKQDIYKHNLFVEGLGWQLQLAAWNSKLAYSGKLSDLAILLPFLSGPTGDDRSVRCF